MLIFDKAIEGFQIVGYKQFDSLEPIKAKFLYNAEPIDLSQYYISFQCKKPDGNIVVDDENITVKNICEIEMLLNEQVTVVNGNVKCQFVLVRKDNERQSTTFTFYLDVRQSVIEGYSSTSTITIADRLNRDIIIAKTLESTLSERIDLGSNLDETLKADIEEGQPLQTKLRTDINEANTFKDSFSSNVVKGEELHNQLINYLNLTKGGMIKKITSTQFTKRTDGYYQYKINHNLSSDCIVVTLIDTDLKEELVTTVIYDDINNLTVLCDTQRNVTVVMNVTGGLDSKAEILLLKQENQDIKARLAILESKLSV